MATFAGPMVARGREPWRQGQGSLQHPGEEMISLGRAPRGTSRGTCLLASSWVAMITLLVTYLALKPEGGKEGGAGRLVLMQKSPLLKGVVKSHLATTADASRGATGAKGATKHTGQGRAGAGKRKQRIMMAAACDCPYADSPLSQVPSLPASNHSTPYALHLPPSPFALHPTRARDARALPHLCSTPPPHPQISAAPKMPPAAAA